MTHSSLEDIPGIGPSRRRALLTHFKNLQALKEASVEDLAAVPGMTRPVAETLHAFFHPQAAEETDRAVE